MTSVSIIIVTYNSEKEMVSCTNSFLSQLNEINGETIIIDNNSTDNTISLIRKIEGKSISIIRNNIRKHIIEY
jgi:glycosyltransferase involved in cell wall biosynthesis